MNIRIFINSATQRGVSLLFALITLVALSLAAVALVRSVNTSSLIVGNLGFKQDSIAYASQAAEAAIAYLNANKTTAKLNTNDTDVAYYATVNENLDPANRRPADATRAVIDWAGDGCATGYDVGSFAACLVSLPSVTGPQGNLTRYTITRLCTLQQPAADPANICARPVMASVTNLGGTGAVDYTDPRRITFTEGGPYFRILVRSVGARNSISYTETIVHF